MRDIEYRPRNVRETLVELKDSSELAVDLAYSSVLLDDPALAAEVLALEERVDDLQYAARIALMLAARRADDAERLAGVFQVVDTAVGVAAAAGDVARVVTGDVGLPERIRAALPAAHEPVFRAEVADGSDLAGRTLDDLDLQVDHGVRVTAVRRGGEWRFAPGPADELAAGDVLIGVGPAGGVATVYERATGEPYDGGEGGVAGTDPEADRVPGLDRAVELVLDLKHRSELAVGLAYSAVLYDSDPLAEEVRSLEAESDALQDELEGWVVDAVPDAPHPHRLRGLLRLAAAAEAIADAALDTAEVVLRDGDVHPVFAQAVRESNEVVTSVRVEPGSPLDGERVGDLELEAETGMVVLAVHGDEGWVYDPAPDHALGAGNGLVARGPRRGEGRLRELARG